MVIVEPLKPKAHAAGTGNGRESSLAAVCAQALQKQMPKLKHNGRKGGRHSKRSHWRAPQLTDEMKRYAVDDAAAALAVWSSLSREMQSRSADKARTEF